MEFLEYIHLLKQYHVTRDYQVISIISDLQNLLRKCSAQELKEKVKRAVFVNIMMHTVGDSKKIYKKYQLYDGCRVLRHLYEGTGVHWRSAAVRTGGSCNEK